MTKYLPNRIEPLPMSYDVYLPSTRGEDSKYTKLASLEIPNIIIKVGDYELSRAGYLIYWLNLGLLIDGAQWTVPFYDGCDYDSPDPLQVRIDYFEDLVYISTNFGDEGLQIFSVTLKDFVFTFKKLYHRLNLLTKTKMVSNHNCHKVFESNIATDQWAQNYFHKDTVFKINTIFVAYLDFSKSDSKRVSCFHNELPRELRLENREERLKRIEWKFKEYVKRAEEEVEKRQQRLNRFQELFLGKKVTKRVHKPSFPDAGELLWEGERQVVFDYCDAENKRTHRQLILASVFKYDGAVYLRGFCQLRQDERIFRFDRTSLTDADLDEIVEKT